MEKLPGCLSERTLFTMFHGTKGGGHSSPSELLPALHLSPYDSGKCRAVLFSFRSSYICSGRVRRPYIPAHPIHVGELKTLTPKA